MTRERVNADMTLHNLIELQVPWHISLVLRHTKSHINGKHLEKIMLHVCCGGVMCGAPVYGLPSFHQEGIAI